VADGVPRPEGAGLTPVATETGLAPLPGGPLELIVLAENCWRVLTKATTTLISRVPISGAVRPIDPGAVGLTGARPLLGWVNGNPPALVWFDAHRHESVGAKLTAFRGFLMGSCRPYCGAPG
jgi:hypothetical protein